jgi:hypothetical protein
MALLHNRFSASEGAFLPKTFYHKVRLNAKKGVFIIIYATAPLLIISYWVCSGCRALVAQALWNNVLEASYVAITIKAVGAHYSTDKVRDYLPLSRLLHT